MISFDKAGKRFGDLDAVKDFSLTMENEEILGLLGPIGAGKTTLTLMMGTAYRPTRGSVISVMLGYEFDRRFPICKWPGLAAEAAAFAGVSWNHHEASCRFAIQFLWAGDKSEGQPHFPK